MKKLIQFAGWMLLLMMPVAIINGHGVTRALMVEYLPGSEESSWVKDSLGQSSPQYQPTIALNHFSDDLGANDTVGAVYSRSSQKVETLISFEKPTAILEKALAQQLEKAGFKVITTSGWNLSPETIPGYLNSDFILGGNLRTFWVESRAGFLTSTINAKVIADLVIADAQHKEIIWNGRITGLNTKKSLAHTNDYFWADLQNSLNKALTQAVNQVFHTEQGSMAIMIAIHNKTARN
jgi:ABC-type antimicrobial peptide transport system permease subunit